MPARVEQPPNTALTDDQGHFVEANDLALNLFGYDKKELRRLNYFQLLHPDQDPEPIVMTVLEVLETGAQVEPLEIKLKSKNGKTIYVQSGGILIPGKAVTFYGTETVLVF